MLVEHHIKYKEIHGVDETVWMEKGEHMKLHKRLRKEGKCKIPVLVLRDISNLANHRARKRRVQQIGFDEPILKNFRIIRKIKYNNHTGKISYSSRFRRCTQKPRKSIRRSDKHIGRIDFHETLGTNVRFSETLRYNPHTENISYTSGFESYHGHILPEVKI